MTDCDQNPGGRFLNFDTSCTHGKQQMPFSQKDLNFIVLHHFLGLITPSDSDKRQQVSGVVDGRNFKSRPFTKGFIAVLVGEITKICL